VIVVRIAAADFVVEIETDLRRRRVAGMPDAKYARPHQVLREQWRPLVESGSVCCARCGRPIVAGKILMGSRVLSSWHLDHLPSGESRPAHAFCNMSAGGRKAGRRRGRRRPRVFAPLESSRRW
jgi:hypothetical protein